MDKELLEILACPKCKGELSPDPLESRLCCRACGLAYRIDDGIPVLMLDEACSYE
ncbi:MAG: Trm112 family protein [Syntrophorhabdaceae bacterium]|nr:Trm112 family protein [Syntrophorhabdaceae bacterium]